MTTKYGGIIPIIDFSGFYVPKDRMDVVHSFATAFKNTGFALVKNHGIDSALLHKTREDFKTFFRLPLEIRMKQHFPEIGGQAGYTPMNVEKGEFAMVADNKHFYQLGDTYGSPYVPEVPTLKENADALYKQFYALYFDLMKLIEIALHLEPGYLTNDLGNSIARNIHYPATDNPTVDDGEVERGGNVAGMCASRHTDINDLTLLHATEPGLQLRYNNEWIPVVCDPEYIIVNIGDMLWHLTGGVYKSGEHRVVCEPGIERFSNPFFGHRKDYANIIPLEHLGPHDMTLFPFKTEGPFLLKRLKEIGLIK